MGQLGKAGNDVADGIDPFFAGLHPFVDLDKTAVEFDVGSFFEADLFRVRPAPDRDHYFLRFQPLLGFTLRRENHGHTIFRLLDFLNRCIDEAIDPFLLEGPQQLFGNLLIFHWNQPWQSLDECDLGSK